MCPHALPIIPSSQGTRNLEDVSPTETGSLPLCLLWVTAHGVTANMIAQQGLAPDLPEDLW